DPDFSVPQEPRDAETMAPRFGRITGDEAIPAEHEEQPQWRSEFESATGISGKRGRSLLSQLLGVLGSGVGLLILAVIFFRFLDVTFWWAFLLIGYPLLRRGARALRKHLDEWQPAVIGPAAPPRPVRRAGPDGRRRRRRSGSAPWHPRRPAAPARHRRRTSRSRRS